MAGEGLGPAGYQAIVISDEEEIQVARLGYCLGHGVKEGLVERVEEWSGVHCAVPLMTGAEVLGTWFDRTREYNARLRGKELEKGESASTEVVVLSPLPCWAHLAPEVYRARIREMVREINESAAAARAESLIPPLGPDGVRAQNPETRPRKIKKSPAPASQAMRKALWEAYGHFVAAFREAGERWREGDRGVAFPVGASRPGCRSSRPERGGWQAGDATRRPAAIKGTGRMRLRRELAGGWEYARVAGKMLWRRAQQAEDEVAGGRRGGGQAAGGRREGGELAVLGAERTRFRRILNKRLE